MATTVPPAALISAAVTSSVSRARDPAATLAPSTANNLAIALPIPRPAPVLIATFPSNCRI